MPLDSGRFPTRHAKYTVVLEIYIQLVVSRLFAGDNRLSLDILLVTTGCQQTLPIRIHVEYFSNINAAFPT